MYFIDRRFCLGRSFKSVVWLLVYISEGLQKKERPILGSVLTNTSRFDLGTCTIHTHKDVLSSSLIVCLINLALEPTYVGVGLTDLTQDILTMIRRNHDETHPSPSLFTDVAKSKAPTVASYSYATSRKTGSIIRQQTHPRRRIQGLAPCQGGPGAR